MSRMYARKKGKSRSTPPMRTNAPEWCTMSAEDVEKVIMEQWNQGKSSASIGTILRDSYGIPDSSLITGKKVMDVVRDAGKAPSVPEDMTNLIRKALNLRVHISENKKDFHNKRSLHLTEAKIRRLVKYYRKTGVLAADWTYKPETAEMLIEA